MNRTQSLLLLAGLVPAFSFSQGVDFLFADYNHVIYQTGQGTSVPIKTQWPEITDWGNYNFYTGADTGEVQSITNFKVTGPSTPAEGEPIPWDGEGYEIELYFDTAGEMTTDIQSGTYTFSGSISTGAFSEDIAIASYSKLTDRLVTNYDALQSFDPTQPVTIEWEEFTEGQGGLGGFVEVWIDYWDQNAGTYYYVWSMLELPIEQLNNFLALDPTVTSVTIPANTLVGSPSGIYTVQLFFLRIDSMGDATHANLPETSVATVTSMDVILEIQDQSVSPPTNPWDVYNPDQAGWADTGPWMGFVNVAKRPWIYSHKLDSYIFVPDAGHGANGAWTYVPRP